MEFICEFCNKSFSTKSNLNSHKKNAKICLLNRDNNQNQNTNNFACKYCYIDELSYQSNHDQSSNENYTLKHYE